jgi:hypothetical protein
VDVRYQEPHNDINLVNEPLAVGSRGGEPAHRPWCRRGFIPSADAHMCGSWAAVWPSQEFVVVKNLLICTMLKHIFKTSLILKVVWCRCVWVE